MRRAKSLHRTIDSVEHTIDLGELCIGRDGLRARCAVARLRRLARQRHEALGFRPGTDVEVRLTEHAGQVMTDLIVHRGIRLEAAR